MNATSELDPTGSVAVTTRKVNELVDALHHIGADARAAVIARLGHDRIALLSALLAPTLALGPSLSRWRVGRKVGRTLYLQSGPRPEDTDVLIGCMDTPDLAAIAVAAVAAYHRKDDT